MDYGKDASRPLDGVRVLALEQFVAGPYGTMLLSDMGAEVIKVEYPEGGDQTRLKRFDGPYEGGRREVGTFALWNRNKKSLTLDLQKERGKELFRELTRRADVVWENMKPGSLARLGFPYETLRDLNPGVIYATVSGFGHQDIFPHPQGDRPAFDIIPQALSGLMHVAAGPGREPKWLGTIVGDIFPSMLAAWGVTLALLHRQRTGLGQHVDLAMYDACVMLNERALGLYALTGQDVTQATDCFVSPQDSFPCRDGYVVIAPQSLQTWNSFCQAIGRGDLLTHPALANPSLRSLNFRKVLNPIFAAWARDKTRAEVLELLARHGVPCAPVQTNAEVVADPQVAARRMLVDLDDPVSGPTRAVGNAIKLSACPETPAGRPPELGEHSEAVLAEWLGLDGGEIAQLRAERVI